MADSFTTNLSLTKPGDGESEDTWGVKLNGNFDTLDGLFGTNGSLAVVNGGTGGETPAESRTNLGLGTIATQDASNVAITGGLVDVAQVRLTSSQPVLDIAETDAPTGNRNWRWIAVGGVYALRLYDDAFSSFSVPLTINRSGNTLTSINYTGVLQTGGNVVWNAGNDGAGSGLDADLLDGQQGTFYTNASNMASGNLPVARLPGAALRNQNAFTSGLVTISDQAASGTPGPGDLWIQYV